MSSPLATRLVLAATLLLIVLCTASVSLAKINVTPIALIPLWKTSIGSYMCKFIGDDYVLVSTGWGHFDAKSIDEIYVDGSRATVYVFDVKTGRLIKTVRGSRTVFFFPGCVAEDVAFYGTDAKFNGVPLREILGFTDTRPGNFYGMFCYGDIGAVGHRASGKFYIFSISARKVIYVEDLGDVRRVKIARCLGRYLCVLAGAVNRPNLYVYVVDPYELKVVGKVVVQLHDGVGALDVTNLASLSQSYVLVGGSAGWVYIINGFRLSIAVGTALATWPNPVTYKPDFEYHVPGAGRFYNPFYTVYKYNVHNVFAFKDTGTVGFVYDPLTGKYVVLSNLPGRAACVSPSGRYVFIGNTLFRVVRSYETKPHIRVLGDVVLYDVQILNTLSALGNISTKEYKIYIKGVVIDVTGISGKHTVLELRPPVKGKVETREALFKNNAELRVWSEWPRGDTYVVHAEAVHKYPHLIGFQLPGPAGTAVASAVVLPFRIPPRLTLFQELIAHIEHVIVSETFVKERYFRIEVVPGFTPHWTETVEMPGKMAPVLVRSASATRPLLIYSYSHSDESGLSFKVEEWLWAEPVRVGNKTYPVYTLMIYEAAPPMPPYHVLTDLQLFSTWYADCYSLLMWDFEVVPPQSLLPETYNNFRWALEEVTRATGGEIWKISFRLPGKDWWWSMRPYITRLDLYAMERLLAVPEFQKEISDLAVKLAREAIERDPVIRAEYLRALSSYLRTVPREVAEDYAFRYILHKFWRTFVERAFWLRWLTYKPLFMADVAAKVYQLYGQAPPPELNPFRIAERLRIPPELVYDAVRRVSTWHSILRQAVVIDYKLHIEKVWKEVLKALRRGEALTKIARAAVRLLPRLAIRSVVPLVAFYGGVGLGEAIYRFAKWLGISPKDVDDKLYAFAGLILINLETGRKMLVLSKMFEIPGIKKEDWISSLREITAVNYIEVVPDLKYLPRTGGRFGGMVIQMDALRRVLEPVLHRHRWKPEQTGIYGIAIVVVRVTRTKPTVLQLVFGGEFKFSFNIRHHFVFYRVDVTRGATTDPREIARTLQELLWIAGIRVVPETLKNASRVVVGFEIPLEKIPDIYGVEDIRISGIVKLDVIVSKNCKPITIGNVTYGWDCSFTWEAGKLAAAGGRHVALMVKEIDIMMLPEPAKLIEWRWVFRNITKWSIVYVNTSDPDYPVIEKLFKYTPAWADWLSKGNLFELNTTVIFENKRYYSYLSVRKSGWLAGARLAEPGQTYIVHVWTRLPPDVGISGILFNGTEITSTIPHYMTIVVYSTVPQRVKIRYGIEARVFLNGTWWRMGRPLVNETEIEVKAGENLITIPIGKYLEAIYKPLQLAGKNATFNVILYAWAKIVSAEHDYIKANDMAANNCTFPVPYYKGRATLIVRVYDASTGRPISGAEVTVYKLPAMQLVGKAVTGPNGTAEFTVYFGMRYRVCAVAPGYRENCEEALVDQYVFVLNLPLYRAGVTPTPVPVPIGHYLVTVLARYEDGRPYTCMHVEIRVHDTGELLCEGHTNGLGQFMCAVRAGTVIDIYGEATVGGKTYRFKRAGLVVDRDITVIFTLPLISPVPPPPGVNATLAVYVYDVVTAKPLSGVTVRVVDLETGETLEAKTNATGWATFRVKVCKNYRVSAIPPPGYVARRYYDIHVDKRLFILNYPLARGPVRPQFWKVTVLVYYKNGVPYTGAHVEIWNATSGRKIAEGSTNSRGQFIIVVPNGTVINVYVRARVNATYVYEEWRNNTLVVNDVVIKFIVPAYGKKAVPPHLNATLAVHVFDAVNRTPIPGADVYVTAYFLAERLHNVTNATGWAAFYVMKYHYYGVDVHKTGYKMAYRDLEIYVARNLTVVHVPMIPEVCRVVGYTGNNTLLPTIICDNITYVPVVVQVLFRDGAPFQGAVVEFYNSTSGVLLLNMTTDGRGIALIYVPNSTELDIRVLAVWRNETFEKWINDTKVTAGLWIVVRTPWLSPWFLPEVMLMRLVIWAHRGVGLWLNKSVPHMYYIEIWSNTRQRIKVRFELWEVYPNGTPVRLLKTWYKTYTVKRGITVDRDFFTVRVLKKTYVRLHAVIVEYENDTNTANNELWSNIVCLRPLIDLAVYIYVVPLHLKKPPFILPEDVVKIAVHVVSTARLPEIPVNVSIHVGKYVPWKMKFVKHVKPAWVHKVMRNTTSTWVNFTVVVPWTRKLLVNVTIASPLDAVELNNWAAELIDVAEEIKMVSVRAPTRAIEKQKVTFVVHFKTNLHNDTVLVIVSGNGTYVELPVKLNQTTTDYTVALTFTLPENPKITPIPILPFIKISQPEVTYIFNVTLWGPDVYLEDNNATVYMKVSSKAVALAFMAALALVILLALIFAVLLITVLVRAARRRAEVRETEFV